MNVWLRNQFQYEKQGSKFCKDSETTQNSSLVLCHYFRISINVKFVDKNTNASLSGTSNATYKLDVQKHLAHSYAELRIGLNFERE